MPLWSVYGNGRTLEPGDVVKPNQRLSWPATIAMGAQHVIAMFGATFLVPFLTGFPIATTLLFSGVGTILFLIITRNKVPSYLGSSFAFIAPVTAAMATGGFGSALAGIIAVGVLLAIVGLIVNVTGIGWVNRLMPPVVAGTIVALIGFNLAPLVWNNGGNGGRFEDFPVTATVTLAAVVLFGVMFRGFLGRISIFLGVIVGYVVALLRGEIDFSKVDAAAWVGLPQFHFPDFASSASWTGIVMFLPVVLVLIAENVGHVRGVASMSGDKSVNDRTGSALVGDGLATAVAGFFGGSGTTTYGENIGVMAATRVYSTAVYWVAAIFAIVLSMSPKVGEVINSIPGGVLAGVTTALYGLIGVIGIKIWIDNRIDLSRPVNQLTAAVGLVIAIAGFTVTIGDIQLGAIVVATIATLLIYHVGNFIARVRHTGADDGGPIPAVGPLGGDPEN